VRVFVVDASLVVKWFVPEVHSEAARRWLEASHDYIAPDLVFPEAGNAIWKKIRRRELSGGHIRRRCRGSFDARTAAGRSRVGNRY
jgi:predicted nucleic acid-binding protein